MAVNQKEKSRNDFTQAATGKKAKKKISWKLGAAVAVPVIGLIGYFGMTSGFTPPQGNNLYGVCRAFIEQNIQFPDTLKIIQFEQRIPDGENPDAPQRINFDVSFSSIDGFGQHQLNTLTCGFRFDQALVNTPWQGIILERTSFNGREDHGWSDVYYPPDKKDPRAQDDRSEKLELFYNGIPSLLVNPPDLTLPWKDLSNTPIEGLKDF